jgi:predicted ATP-dependent endonuclease of OLD family
MKINNIYIKNFRSIEKANVSLKDLTLLIGNNATGKTSILEALNFALSPYYISGKIQQSDFYNATNDPVIIEVEFDQTFIAKIPDGYVEQEVICKKIHLEIKKRERATPNKSFSDSFSIKHYFVPVNSKNNPEGWEQEKKNGNKFKFTELQLASNFAIADDVVKGFYFSKNRSIQLKRGYNSSTTNIFDDFNWRFVHNLQKDEGDYFTNKDNIEKQVISKVDDKTLSKSIVTLNEKLKNFGINQVRISLFESHSPFNSAFFSNDVGKMNISTESLGSGIEMIISLLLLETLASLSKDDIVIIIDEPELHLHPTLQEQFVQYLKTISPERQIIVSTHSPYFFKNCCLNNNIKLLVTKIVDNKSLIEDAEIQLSTFPWSPSWGEINYFAYDLPTVEFHNELYGYLYYISSKQRIIDFEKYLIDLGIINNRKWLRDNNGNISIFDVTLMTYIRNFIHHPENQRNSPYTPDELKLSISQMLDLIKKIIV